MGAWGRGTFEEMVRNQDDELNYRILEGGGRIVLVPGVRSIYAVRSTPWALRRQYFQYRFWRIRVMQKHPGQVRLRHLVPWLFVLGLVGTFAASWVAPWAGALCAAIGGSYGIGLLSGCTRFIPRLGATEETAA